MTDSGKTLQAALPASTPANRTITVTDVTVLDNRTSHTPRATAWADVRAIFRIAPPDESSWSMVEITRPHAVIGRKSGADIAIGHPDLESLHTYLNFDTNGCFAIDLRTGSGMRLNGRAVTHGRIGPGDTLEVGGFLIRLDGYLINGKSFTREDLNDSPLSASHTASLTGLTLHYNGSKQRRWAISSAIAFVGSEQTCSVALPEHPNVSRIHGVFVRTPRNVYFVDLASRGTLLNGKRIYNESIELHHNDTLSIGQRGLRVQLAQKPLDDQNRFPMDEAGPYTTQASPKFNTADPQVMMAALLTQIQKQHDTALERQNEMQVAIAQLLRQVQNEQSRTLEKHLERIQHLDLEIATLKSTIQTEESPRKKLEDIPSQTVTTITPPRLKQPSAAPEPARPAPQPAAELPGDLDASPEYTTAWLLDRVSQLDQEQTSVWKEMLGRFLGR